jgi:hypothetical protein
MIVPRIETPPSDESQQSPMRRQFSLRKLFVFVAVASGVLALVVNPPPWIVLILLPLAALAIVAVVPGAAIVFSSMTSQERPLIATVSWLLFASLLVYWGINRLIEKSYEPAFAALCGGAIAAFKAWRAFQLRLPRND